MKATLYDLLQVSLSDPDSPNILLTVHLSDLHQLVVNTIEATRERLLPIFMEAEKDKPLTKEQAAELLGVCETTVWDMVQSGKLHTFKVNRLHSWSRSPECHRLCRFAVRRFQIVAEPSSRIDL